MSITLIALFLQAETNFREPGYFAPAILGLLGLGAVAWLVAAVLGFARARAFGPSTRWFAFAAVCMIIYHLQFLFLALGLLIESSAMTLTVGAFFNLFVILAALCCTMGFIRLTNPR